jgi:hypothetical protein
VSNHMAEGGRVEQEGTSRSVADWLPQDGEQLILSPGYDGPRAGPPLPTLVSGQYVEEGAETDQWEDSQEGPLAEAILVDTSRGENRYTYTATGDRWDNRDEGRSTKKRSRYEVGPTSEEEFAHVDDAERERRKRWPCTRVTRETADEVKKRERETASATRESAKPDNGTRSGVSRKKEVSGQIRVIGAERIESRRYTDSGYRSDEYSPSI